jgi:hypothetical protein
MKVATIGLLALVFGSASGQAGAPSQQRWHMAQSAEVCLSNCASQNDSCKRVCPTTYAGPCLSACDNQAQFCQQSCQRK